MPGVSTAFDVRRFQSLLDTKDIGRMIDYRAVTITTMDDARQLAADGCPHGALVLAEEQTAGRGRRGRSFHSPAGENLYFTMVLRVDGAVLRKAPVAVPLAVAEACRDAGTDARIKWPNDVWVDERKLCGMLIDSEIDGAGAVLFPGIGINVNGDPTRIPELAAIATSLRRELGHPVDRELLLARICNHLERFLAMPPAGLATRYRDLSLVLGRDVQVTESEGTAFPARAIDIGDDGSLLVELADGGQRSVTAADVSIRPA
jgi:BirA family transcriptional regulator, biotin operon repressor / biotin---[acetyl-CoA-carboxylase] ligase